MGEDQTRKKVPRTAAVEPCLVIQDLLELITSLKWRVCADAIAAINIFIPDKLQVVLANIDLSLQRRRVTCVAQV